MQLSIIIVSYNVKHFLSQCLQSVLAATKEIESEIFVVDNVSTDGTVEEISSRFPQIKLIANQQNVGFSKANNQAIQLAQGNFILILNPDTVVAEDTFVKCIAFMLSKPDAGALGVKMIDGTGAFLPESKRGLPTPAVAFYKMFGLASLFSKSKVFGKYHLGYLDENETHEVEILSGAFMFFRKTVLDQIGSFDESFFMYGEDIDLSWRVILGGWKNYYLANNTIIHYKGESTKRGSLNYVKVFYEAMIIFARKHFAKQSASVFSALINLAVVFRALLTLFANLISYSLIIVLDIVLLYFGTWLVTNYWASNIKSSSHYYPDTFLWFVLPAYCLVWLLSNYISGGYEKPFKLGNVLRGVVVGTVVIASIYAFLPENLRYSRAVILLGAAVALAVLLFNRLIYNWMKHKRLSFDDKIAKNILLLGEEQEANRALNILNKHELVDFSHIMSDTLMLDTKAKLFEIDEVVFCSQSISFRKIIDAISQNRGVMNFKILNPDSDLLIGSNSKNTQGEVLTEGARLNLSQSLAQRKKRLFDIALCLPLLFSFKGKVYQNWWAVLKGEKTWVGYMPNQSKSLPFNKAAVFPVFYYKNISTTELETVNLLYAKNYRLVSDIKILIRQLLR